MNQLFAKLSILFLYYRLFHINQRFLYCVYALGSIQIAWSIGTTLVHYFECWPTAKLWDSSLQGYCINSEAFLAGGETPNSLVDFALIGLAVWMVHALKSIKTGEKVRLYAIFTIGGLYVILTLINVLIFTTNGNSAGILGFVKIGEGFGAESASKVELLDPIWATVQQTCSVICCCAPLYKPLFPDLGIFRSIHSLTSSVFGNKSGANNSNNSNNSRSTDGTAVSGKNFVQLQDYDYNNYNKANANSDDAPQGMWKQPLDEHSNENEWFEMRNEMGSRKTSASQDRILPQV
jgi:hypothetical protein